MTTIAWDGYDIAADGQTTDSGLGTIIDLTTKKLVDVGQGCTLGAAGNASDCQAVSAWIANGEKPEDRPIPVKNKDKDTSFEAICVGPGGCFYMDKTLVPVELAAPQAVGSGWVVAMSAMKLGKTAKEAVELASQLDIYTGGKIQVVHVRPRPKGKK